MKFDPHPQSLTTEEKEKLKQLRNKNTLELTSDDFLTLEALNFADVRERYRISKPFIEKDGLFWVIRLGIEFDFFLSDSSDWKIEKYKTWRHGNLSLGRLKFIW